MVMAGTAMVRTHIHSEIVKIFAKIKQNDMNMNALK